MEKILVVGATGQLGAAAIRKLVGRGASVRALVRSSEAVESFGARGIEAVLGDLTDAPSLDRACSGIGVIVATANAAIPTRESDTFAAVDRLGYRNLIQAAVNARIRRFIYTSVPTSKYERLTPFFQFKRETEKALAASSLDSVIFRADIFMDVAFVMMGSTIPLRGSERPTVLRPFSFASRHLARIKDSIEHKKVALVPGDGTARHRFVCVDDVAEFLVAAASGGPSGIHAVGGPEALTFLDIVHLYERVLNIKVRPQHAPAMVFRCAAPLIRPFSPAGSNIMCLNYIAAKEETLAESASAPQFGVRLTSAETFLRAKNALPAK